MEWNKKGMRSWDYIYIVLLSTLFGLYGAKIWYIIFDADNAFGPDHINSFKSFLFALFVPSSGRTIIGTIVFAILAIYLYPKLFSPDINWLKAGDILMPAILLSQSVGRWGNFANHSVYGLETTKEALNWLPVFIQEHLYIEGEYREPLFLYESFADIGIFVIIFITFKTNNMWGKGSALSAYIMLYGVTRAGLELFRDEAFIMRLFGLPSSFIIAIILAIVGFLSLIICQPNTTKPELYKRVCSKK